MRQENKLLSILAGFLLISLVCSPSAHATGETLLLSINSGPPGIPTTALVTISNASDIESFSLTLYYSSGTVLSLPAVNWFTRGAYFPEVLWGATEYNNVQVSSQKKIYFNGFSPTGTSGSVGAVTFDVSSDAVANEIHILSISGNFFSKSEQVIKQFMPGSTTFTVIPDPLPPHTLTVTKSGNGTGVVQSSPSGIDCGGDCSELYSSGTQILLTPHADPGSQFTGFSNGCTGTGACVVTLNQATTVQAAFNINTTTSTILPTTTSVSITTTIPTTTTVPTTTTIPTTTTTTIDVITTSSTTIEPETTTTTSIGNITADGLIYTEANGIITIIDYICPDNDTLVIPDTIEGKPVWFIAEEAFKDCAALTSVTISKNVASIGDSAFNGCSGLITVVFNGNAPTNVGGNVFYNCGSGFTIWYYRGAKEFTNPWYGYPTKVIGKCPVLNALGNDEQNIENLRNFRDSSLAQSALGRKAIRLYYNNADSINAALERSPALRKMTRTVLEIIAPMVGNK